MGETQPIGSGSLSFLYPGVENRATASWTAPLLHVFSLCVGPWLVYQNRAVSANVAPKGLS